MTDGPDLARGIPTSSIGEDGKLVGRVGDQEVLIVRAGGAYYAVDPFCTHYHGPLAEGLVVGETIRCPLHHACFNLRTGEALRAPAIDPISCWKVEVRDGTLRVREKLAAPARTGKAGSGTRPPSSVVIVGAGGGALAAAEMLRREGYDGPITMIGAEPSPPTDVPNLSKEYLSGEAPEEWLPLRTPDFYAERKIELELGVRATGIDLAARNVTLEGGTTRPFDALLIATGADPLRPPIPGAAGARVHTLRTVSDSRAIVKEAGVGRHAVVVGASFIGLEVAASLRHRGVTVDVVAPEPVPLQRVLGSEVGRFVLGLHQAQGVIFHLGQTVTKIDGGKVTLSGGATLEADFIVLGVGVRPAVQLAEQAGLPVNGGILVDEYLETSVPGIFAAGDVARWRDRRTGETRRVEHWVVAERQGQAAARNILGRRVPFDDVPFFWSKHYDVTINYVGHAEAWDAVAIDGDLARRDCTVTYLQGGKPAAVATIGRDRASLEAELAMETAAGLS